METRIKTGAVEPIRVQDRRQQTGLADLFVRLQRESDGFFLDWADLTFKSSLWTTKEKILTQVDATNLPGLYEVVGRLDFSAITNKVANDDYTIFPLQTPGTNARLPGARAIQEGDWVDDIGYKNAAVFVDSVLGSSTGIGTDTDPVATLAQAKVIMDASKRRTAMTRGSHTLTETMDGFILIGNDQVAFVNFDLNSNGFSGEIRNMTVLGAGGGPSITVIQATDCLLSNISAAFLIGLKRCSVIGTITLTSSFGLWEDVIGSSTILDFDGAGTFPNIIMARASGEWIVDNMGHASSALVIAMNGGKTTINVTCTLGTITVRGSGELINNAVPGTVTVIDKRNPIPLLERNDFLALKDA